MENIHAVIHNTQQILFKVDQLQPQIESMLQDVDNR
jgi:hypothetical protein